MKITALRAAELNDLYERLENIDGLIQCLRIKGANWSIAAFNDAGELGSTAPLKKDVRPLLDSLRAATVTDITRLGGVVK